MVVSTFFLYTLALPKDLLTVVGPLIEGNDAEKLRTLSALFDRVAGLSGLVNAFKLFVTVGHASIAAHIFLTGS
jgi:hypothetical protein